ncbi:WD40 repeat protein [Schistosoma haematobium]|uniref:WD40 repeat protein n=2 Tax=Schistosoma haematobium TaxID=6185 RepID=A0A922LDW2_SCHHA|nr:WD40 repeat protein [Schistosoma haematobium]KAH9578493.1 WD40 repeat protein [Schistosoma haematobium]
MNHYINMTNLIVVVFDVTNQESFSSAKLTLRELRKPNNIRIPVVLVGNKTDLKEKHINNVEKARGLADDLGIPYFETSAKEAVGIDVPFLHLIKEYYELYNDAVNDYQTLV